MMKSPLKLSIFQQFHNRDQPENMLRCICLAPIRNAVNTRLFGPDKTGKEKKNTITLRKEPSMGKHGRLFCVEDVKGGKNYLTKLLAKVCTRLQK